MCVVLCCVEVWEGSFMHQTCWSIPASSDAPDGDENIMNSLGTFLQRWSQPALLKQRYFEQSSLKHVQTSCYHPASTSLNWVQLIWG